jgi:hypothetical protein
MQCGVVSRRIKVRSAGISAGVKGLGGDAVLFMPPLYDTTTPACVDA